MYVVDFLRSRGVWFELLLHRPASSSAKRAGNVHVPGRRVAKAVLVKSGDAYLLAVLPSTSQIDLDRFSAVVGAEAARVRLATLDEVFAFFPDCEPGVVPPFGQLYGLKTVVDSDLAEFTDIVVVANTRHEGLRMRFADFQTLEDPVRASFSRPSMPRTSRATPASRRENRRAG